MNTFGLSVLGVLAGLAAIGLLLFLGGLASAALEVRRERRAGVPVTRPAWDRRDALRAAGGHRGYLRGLVKGLRA